MKRKLILCLLLIFSFFVESISCAAKTEDPFWRKSEPDWSWGEREWETAWGTVRELTSDNIGRLPTDTMTFTIPEGQEVLTGTEFSDEPEKDKIAEVKLPASLRVIKDEAFGDLQYMKKITIPSGVTEIGKNIFFGCENLRTIENLSSQTIQLHDDKSTNYLRFYIGPCGLEYYVDGKKVSEIPPGKTAIGKEKFFPLIYNLNGGEMVGKRVKTYCYGESETKLPKVKRKGYIFLGWSFKIDIPFSEYAVNDYKTWFSLYDQKGLLSGEKFLTARWKKVRVKKTGNKKIQIRLYNRDYNDKWKIACLYSTHKNMKGAKFASLSEGFENTKKKGKILGTKTKNYVTNYYPKKKLLTADLKKLKKGKTYYLQFRRINEFVGGYFYMNAKVLKTVKVSM